MFVMTMRYDAEIDGDQLRVELEERDGRVQARVGTRGYELEVISPEPGVFTLSTCDRVYEANVWEAGPNSLRVMIAGHAFATNIIDRKHKRPSIDHAIEGRQNLLAPMPGKVVRVILAAGDPVESGQGVVIVEAMKMQNEIKSPKSGRVIEVRIAEGATVNANQILAVIE